MPVASGQITPAQRALTLLELHQPGNPVILPTVWDAWSARLATDAGFAALTVGSHPLADSIGKPDGEGMSFDDVLARVAQITAAVDVPVSVDIESGYGLPAARLSPEYSRYLCLGQGSKQRRILYSEPDSVSGVARLATTDKYLTKQLLEAAGVPVPRGKLLEKVEDAWPAANAVGLPVAVDIQTANR